MRIFLAASILLISGAAYADHVNGYNRKDGSYVEPYERTHRNETQKDNYSYDGNANPYTGKTGHTKKYDAYGNEQE